LAALRPACRLAGYELGLVGSVLFDGASTKDVDLVAFHTSTADSRPPQLTRALHLGGLTRELTAAEVRTHWRRRGSLDEKHVEVWRDARGRRVDLFLFDGRPPPATPTGMDDLDQDPRREDDGIEYEDCPRCARRKPRRGKCPYPDCDLPADPEPAREG
jgi:hypothetical protein